MSFEEVENNLSGMVMAGKESPLSRRLDDLKKSRVYLSEKVAELENRLKMILADRVPNVPIEQRKLSEESPSPLTQRLFDEVDLINELAAKVEMLIGKIDI